MAAQAAAAGASPTKASPGTRAARAKAMEGIRAGAQAKLAADLEKRKLGGGGAEGADAEGVQGGASRLEGGVAVR